ncbi:HAD-IA family hydrolase [bacterium]|nr:HAD-IA family hydrolase [bacterium]
MTSASQRLCASHSWSLFKGQSVGLHWVVFDAVGTLIDPSPDVATVYHRVGCAYGSRMSRDEVRVRFRAAFRRTEASERSRASGMSTCEADEVERWKQIVAEVFDDLPPAVADDCFRELFEHFARPTAWTCFEDVAPTIAVLRERELNIAVASNFDSRLHTVCDGLPPLDEIAVRVVSSEVGFNKPSSGFYAAVLRLADASPDEALVVGDDAINDVQGAEQAGIRGVLIDRGRTRLFSTGASKATESEQRDEVIHSLLELAELIP